MYYDESQIGSNYTITSQQYIYYFLFSLTSIPVQICIDIFVFNIIENFHNQDFRLLLSIAKLRFKNRRTMWKGLDEDIDLTIKKDFRSKDQIFMSPQFYFMVTLHITGLTLLCVGSITMISNTYYVFNDYFSPFIVLFWILMLKFLENFSMYAAKKLRIWRVSNSKFKN